MYDAWLALGFERTQAIGRIVHRHVPEALIPGLDQVRTAGVVTLPGPSSGCSSAEVPRPRLPRHKCSY